MPRSGRKKRGEFYGFAVGKKEKEKTAREAGKKGGQKRGAKKYGGFAAKKTCQSALGSLNIKKSSFFRVTFDVCLYIKFDNLPWFVSM